MSRLKVAYALAALPLVTLSVSGGIFALQRPAGTVAVVAKAAPVGKEKELSQAGATQAGFIGTGHYAGEQSSKSKIQTDTIGTLFTVARQGSDKHFVLAAEGTVSPSQLALGPGWSATPAGVDPMWLPGACAQKPSWLIGDHFIVIDDGSYDGTKTTHYYALYDTQTKLFTHFGGALASDAQAKEKIIGIAVEGTSLVFYIDHQDTAGPYQGSTSFKHALASHEPSLIKRVIDIPSLAYTDFRVAFTKPSFDDYHVSVATDGPQPVLTVSPDGAGSTLSGVIQTSGTVALATSAKPVVPPAHDALLDPYKAAVLALINPVGTAYPADLSTVSVKAASPTTLYANVDNPGSALPIVIDRQARSAVGAFAPGSTRPNTFVIGVQ